MKKHYFLNIGLLLSGLFSTFTVSSQGLTLSDVQCNINVEFTSITNLVPNMYVFDYDGGNDYIDDGGYDMYDGGNYLNTDITTEILYSDDVIISSTDFGTNGQYFTRELPGFFMLAADVDGIEEFFIDGNNGADGSGMVFGSVFTLTAGGVSFDVFHKSISGAGDPAIFHFIIIPSNSNAVHDFSTDSDEDYHSVSNISATTRLYYFLVSSYPDMPLSTANTEAIAQAFLNAIYGSGSFSVNATSTSVCEGESVTLTASGATTYNWDNGITNGLAFVPPIGSTEYTVNTVNGAGCYAAASITISTLSLPEFTLTPSDVFFANDGAVFLSLNNGVFPFVYDWDNDGTGDFDDTQSLMNVPAGTYTVVVQHGNGCTATATAVVGSQVGVEEFSSNVMLVYPNPTNSSFNIRFEGNFTYQLMDVTGKLVFSGNAINSTLVSFDDFTSGIYTLQLMSGDKVLTTKIVKN